ncbi:MAG: choice-of-anchor D domain-containing protein [Deltaproteobacteria bacterium]|nr:choice-of-anchor D domain-containing protein [Deltaproteobacteria bacterium]
MKATTRRSRWWRSPLILALLAFPLANCDCQTVLTSLPEPHIEVQDEESNKLSEADPWLTVNFGDVDQGTSSVHELTIYNSNTGKLTIDNICLVAASSVEDAIADDAPCIRGGETPFTFPNIIGEESVVEGETAGNISLPITFSTTEGGAYTYFLRIETNDEANPRIALQLIAQGTAGRLCADNAILDFGQHAIGTTSDPLQITLSNCGVKPITVDTYAMLQNPDDAFAVTVAGQEPVAPFTALDAGESIVLDVTFTPTQVQAYRDIFAGSLQLTTAAPFAASYTLLLVGDGTAPPSCRVNVVPTTVQFGSVAATETQTQDLIIQSVGECACTVESLTLPTPDDVGFSIPDLPTLPLVLSGTRGCDSDPAGADAAENLLRVTFTYTAPDSQVAAPANATVDVVTTDNDTPNRTVNLEATGGGTPYCELEVTPIGGGALGGLIPTQGRYGVVEFGRTSIFFEKRLPIELKNIGNADCHINQIQWDVEENTLQNEFSLENEDQTTVNMGAANITVSPNTIQRYFAVFSPTHVIEANGIFDVLSFGAYSASHSQSSFGCGGPISGPNTKCNGVNFITDDDLTDVSESGMEPGVFSIGFSATPVKPQIDVIPGELDFGLVTVGCGSPQIRVTVYNTGSGDLIIDEPYIDPANTPADFEITATGNTSPFPYTIPPGSSMPINVRYRANAIGLVTGQIVVPTVEEGQVGPPVSIPIQGEGTLETEQTDIFDQFQDPTVDVLWVVDDSGSMSAVNANLAANFPDFFTASNVNAADYHIAVTTTLTADSCVPDFSGNNTCEDDPMSGHYTACGGNDRFLTPASADPAGQFVCNVKVDNSSNVNPSRPGSDDAEGGLGAAKNFLSGENVAAGGPNEGFMRDDAKLHVIVVSDEPDQSRGPIDLYVDFFRNLKGFRNDSLVALSAIAAPNGGCGSGDSSPTGDARYPDTVAALNGRFESICSSDWTGMMSALGLDSLGLRVEFFLSRSADSATLDVCVVERDAGGTLGACNAVAQTSDGAADGYFYDLTSNSIVFNPGSIPGRGSRVQVHYQTFCHPLD